MTIKTHAEFSPSQLHRILKCPGSVRLSRVLEKSIEEEPSEYAKEGTMLHEVIERTLLDDRDTCQTPEGKAQSLTLDQCAAVDDAKEYFQSLYFDMDVEQVELRQEVHTSLESWDLPEVAGWVDVMLLDKEHKTLHVIDWKFGSGVQVFSHRDEQMMAYACGGVIEFDLEPDWVVVVHIVQPKLDHYDTWATNPTELHKWVAEEVAPLVLQSLTEEPTFNPGANQCRWCPVKDHCDHRIQWIKGTMIQAFEMAAKIPKVKDQDIADILAQIPGLKKAISDIEKYALNEILAGRQIPGYKAVYGRSLRKWIDEDFAYDFLSERFDEEQIYTKKIISPAQAEKLDKSLKKDDEFSSVVEKPMGKPTVVRESDKRTAIGPTRTGEEAFKDFS
jgi:hypothetical protein